MDFSEQGRRHEDDPRLLLLLPVALHETATDPAGLRDVGGVVHGFWRDLGKFTSKSPENLRSHLSFSEMDCGVITF